MGLGRESTHRAGRAALWLGAALLLAYAPAFGAPSTGASKHTLYTSRELWATIDVCNPPDQANVIGIRGSMPSDSHPKDAMYMRFVVQIMEPTTRNWTNLGKNADSGWAAVGSSKSARQSGRSFELVPKSTSATLRGLVEFQWRRGRRIVYQSSRITVAGHESLAGADPKDYSQATCTIG